MRIGRYININKIYSLCSHIQLYVILYSIHQYNAVDDDEDAIWGTINNVDLSLRDIKTLIPPNELSNKANFNIYV
jgi:hypothetical protein